VKLHNQNTNTTRKSSSETSHEGTDPGDDEDMGTVNVSLTEERTIPDDEDQLSLWRLSRPNSSNRNEKSSGAIESFFALDSPIDTASGGHLEMCTASLGVCASDDMQSYASSVVSWQPLSEQTIGQLQQNEHLFGLGATARHEWMDVYRRRTAVESNDSGSESNSVATSLVVEVLLIIFTILLNIF